MLGTAAGITQGNSKTGNAANQVLDATQALSEQSHVSRDAGDTFFEKVKVT